MNKLLIIGFMTVFTSCNNEDSNAPSTNTDTSKESTGNGSFGYDLHFLQKHHKDLVRLGDDSAGAQIIIVPAYQGRVMTSTAEGKHGLSFGWVNHELIESGKPVEHINAFGGEERLWLGPEGGQFSVYFKKGAAFQFDNWFVPKEFNTEPFTLIRNHSRWFHQQSRKPILKKKCILKTIRAISLI